MSAEQPRGRMTVMSLPEHLRDEGWQGPQELEVRVAGELVLYGLITGYGICRLEARCANPDCPGNCAPSEMLRLEVEVAPQEDQ